MSGKRKASASGKKSKNNEEWGDNLRYLLCVHHEENPGMSQGALRDWVEREHKINITQATVSNTLKKGKSAFPPSSSQKRQREALWPDVEKALYEWILAYQNTVALTGDMVKTKAAVFYKRMHSDGNEKKFAESAWSNGWLEGFQGRFGIKNWRRHGESGSVKAADITTERPKLQQVLSKYPTKDIYNMDETGLFWKLQSAA
ncbi:unnamed protein product [Tilletia controversa]|nr:unnamed protein product [Tilletia controversa]